MILQKPFKTICAGIRLYVLLLLSLNVVLADSTTNRVQVLLVGTLPTLTAGAPTNGQIQVALSGEAGVAYTLQSSPDLVNWTAVATNSNGPASRRFTLPAPATVVFYRASRAPIPLFTYALAARGDINLNGNGVTTDSWNSRDTNFSTGGVFDPTKINTNGNVASVSGTVNLGNRIIEGNLYLGPFASYTGGAGTVTGQIFFDANVSFPDISLPSVTWQTAPLTAGIHKFTNSGCYLVTDPNPITVSTGVVATVYVTTTYFGPASITILGGTTNSGTLIVYQQSGSASFIAHSAYGSRPENFIYLGLPGVTNVAFSATATFTGVVYAPEATGVLNGGGISYSVVGSCILNSAPVNDQFSFHFDEALMTSGPYR